MQLLSLLLNYILTGFYQIYTKMCLNLTPLLLKSELDQSPFNKSSLT